MASLGLLEWQVTIQDATGFPLRRGAVKRFNPLSPNGVVQQVALPASTFTALSVPAGATHMAILLNGAVSLSLKGLTGDTGIPLVGTTARAWDVVLMPINSTTIGILNSGASAASVEVLFL